MRTLLTRAALLAVLAACSANAPAGDLSDAGASAGGGSDPATCRAVCARYRECSEASYDVDACVARCTAGTHGASCGSCLLGRGCIFLLGCGQACAGVLN